MAKFNYERAATILVEAAYFGDQKTSEKWGASVRSIQRYRERLASDAKLAALVASKKKLFEGAWAEGLPGAIMAGIRYLEKAPEELPYTPEGVHAVAGSVKLLSGIETTKRILDSRLATDDEEPAKDA